MKFGNSLSSIQLEQNEYCIMTSNQHYTSSYINVKIPKLMTAIPSSRTDYFNRNIFINAKECKPAVSQTVSLQDHISIPRSQQCSLASRADEWGIVPRGTRLIALCMNGNVKDLRIIDVI